MKCLNEKQLKEGIKQLISHSANEDNAQFTSTQRLNTGEDWKINMLWYILRLSSDRKAGFNI